MTHATRQPPAYLTSAADRARWEMLRGNRMLYEGDHRCYFLDESRSQFNYPEELVQGVRVRRYVTFNLCRLVSHTIADLMFGAKAKIEAPDATQQEALDGLARRSMIHSRFHEAAIQASWAGGAFLEITRFDGEVYIEVAPADEIYPQGRPLPSGQYRSYVRYATDQIQVAGQTIQLLLKTTYTAGAIARELHQLDENGRARAESLPLDRWPAFADRQPPVAPLERTGIDRCSIVYLPNKTGDKISASDFDGLITLQDKVNAKSAQLARVIAKHADPKLGMPETAADENGEVRASHDVFFFRSKEEIPQYLVWNAELDAADRDLNRSVLEFCTAAEMSPVLLGIRSGATPDAARKLRLEATKDLAKTNRKSLIMEPAIAMAIEIALQLDQSGPLLRSYPTEPVGVQMRDGLPIDELDQASIVATYRGAGAMSLEDAVELRKQDADAAAAEVARIKDEEAAKMPTVLAPLVGDSTGQGDQTVVNGGPQDRASTGVAA
jgi:hypothetical protein